MAKVLVVTSGKGGVGKTTTTAALGAALAQSGQNVVVIDFDVGLRNLDLVMGAERRVVFDFINVVQGDAKLSQALIRDKRCETLSILPASQTRDKDALTAEGVAQVIDELREKFDWIICDSPAGIERGARWPCITPMSLWSSRTRKSARCATVIASSACSTAQPPKPRTARRWKNTCS